VRLLMDTDDRYKRENLKIIYSVCEQEAVISAHIYATYTVRMTGQT